MTGASSRVSEGFSRGVPPALLMIMPASNWILRGITARLLGNTVSDAVVMSKHAYFEVIIYSKVISKRGVGNKEVPPTQPQV